MNVPCALALASLLTAGVALADDCRQQLPDWIEMAHPGHAAGESLEDQRGHYRLDVEHSICKVWPARPELTLIAVPLVRAQHDTHGEADLQVLVFDNARQHLVAQRVEPNRLDWDAIFIDEMSFDTAAYRLRGDDLAFGVRLSRRNNSSANPFYETRLHLYELNSQHLRPLLSELPVYTYWGELDTHCAGEFSETKGLVVITERIGNQGYRDLQLKDTRVERRMALVDDQCQTVEESTYRYQLPIEYDEERYLLPIELASDPL
jgi:hypothetical protein